MKTDQRVPDSFEERLLGELRCFVATQPAPRPARPNAASRPNLFARRGARLALAGTSMVAIAGVAIAVGHDPAAPAYAVKQQAGGAIDVEIKSLRDAAGLREAFSAHGIDAVVRYLPEGKMCAPPAGAETHRGFATGEPGGAGAPPTTVGSRRGDAGLQVTEHGTELSGSPPGKDGGEQMLVQQSDDGSLRFVLSPNAVPAGKTLLIEGNVGTRASSLGVAVQKAPVKPCKLIDRRDPPAR